MFCAKKHFCNMTTIAVLFAISIDLNSSEFWDINDMKGEGGCNGIDSSPPLVDDAGVLG